MLCNQNDPKPDTILNRLLNTVHKIQHPLSQEEISLNTEHNNSNNLIRHQSPTDQNHNLTFPQSKLPHILLPHKENADGGYQQSDDQNQTEPIQNNLAVEMSLLLELIKKILIQKQIVFLFVRLLP